MAAGKTVSVAGDNYLFLATAAETNGGYSLFDAVVHPGGGPPLHRHSREDEAFYVLSGTLQFTVDGVTHTGTVGNFFHLPKGSLHRFQNVTDQPARMLILAVPSGIEGMFQECGMEVSGLDAAPAPFGPEQIGPMVAAAARYGIEIPPPD